MTNNFLKKASILAIVLSLVSLVSNLLVKETHLIITSILFLIISVLSYFIFKRAFIFSDIKKPVKLISLLIEIPIMSVLGVCFIIMGLLFQNVMYFYCWTLVILLGCIVSYFVLSRIDNRTGHYAFQGVFFGVLCLLIVYAIFSVRASYLTYIGNSSLGMLLQKDVFVYLITLMAIFGGEAGYIAAILKYASNVEQIKKWFSPLILAKDK